jgi:hypothetical protein
VLCSLRAGRRARGAARVERREKSHVCQLPVADVTRDSGATADSCTMSSCRSPVMRRHGPDAQRCRDNQIGVGGLSGPIGLQSLDRVTALIRDGPSHRLQRFGSGGPRDTARAHAARPGMHVSNRSVAASRFSLEAGLLAPARSPVRSQAGRRGGGGSDRRPGRPCSTREGRQLRSGPGWESVCPTLGITGR